ncbi:unnamed protein product [Adineta steineri]|uniref:Uncharacterized protein n=1 Tax=Adineta steineri TaxID=433720 RepID=A0A814TF34_9BILA|nr:unnamed protein product [Adineta steineri]CAF1160887.1 unnamed protein product [Adineta steineri]
MHFVRVSGSIGLTSLWISLISYFLSFILYLISFCLSDWIVYGTVPIKIGIWRLCDIEVAGYDRCADWSSRSYPTNITNNAFLGPPDFVRTSQSLEVVALVFYVIAGILLVVGLCQRSMGLLFFASSMSMFITVIFASATIGLFAAQGKNTFSGHLSFAWWLALVALSISIISAFSLVVLSFYILPLPPTIQNKMAESNGKVFYPSPPYSSNVYAAHDISSEYIH